MSKNSNSGLWQGGVCEWCRGTVLGKGGPYAADVYLVQGGRFIGGRTIKQAVPASNFQRRFAMIRDVMRVKTSAREGTREVYILREVS